MKQDDADTGRIEGVSTDERAELVRLRRENRAQVTDADVEMLRAAGFDDEELVELVAHVALSLFTKYVNVALSVPLNFPKARLLTAHRPTPVE